MAVSIPEGVEGTDTIGDMADARSASSAVQNGYISLLLVRAIVTALTGPSLFVAIPPFGVSVLLKALLHRMASTTAVSTLSSNKTMRRVLSERLIPMVLDSHNHIGSTNRIKHGIAVLLLRLTVAKVVDGLGSQTGNVRYEGGGSRSFEWSIFSYSNGDITCGFSI
ncbi:hypothetical protein L3X38_037552 [Prunus dulcis]|uniref:Uncharacterized protein n=1 Tax=Prunus dulcis TaxID=3755 RepID=A0AAD4YQR2_PRUDU|nr:hypothetical protein L3X38_037552 [Prunus dulcis]